MVSSVASASETWHEALKLRKHLLRNLEKLQESSASGLDAGQFESIDFYLDRFRLACVSTIFLDFNLAIDENTEEALWTMHTSINSEYRQILGKLKQSPHIVERRKVEKLYNNFLRIAHKFYKAYIQRLSARYEIPMLKRIARGIHVEQLTTEDTISPVAEDLEAKVLRSCHSTLIRLGDLTRYRIQAKHMGSYDAALAYYALANHLKPHSGFAFHQMGIVNLDQGNYLDVVYHFYRAWAVHRPHPNVKVNLENVFKTQNPNKPRPAPKHRSAVAQDALSTWFVRLHAANFQGQPYGPKHEELEKEVMYRLEKAGRNKTPVHSLLKMALINMSALHVATQRYHEKQTEANALFYQLTMRFNVLFIGSFCQRMRVELQNTTNADSVPENPDATEILEGAESLLPVLRIYCLWLATHRQEMFGAKNSSNSLLLAMTQVLARVFTLLCVEIHNQENIKTAPYLLMEDIEILGFQPLSKDKVPEACRFFCDDHGSTKALPLSPEARLSASEEKAARLLDILRCAYFLTEDDTVPLAWRIESDSLLFELKPVAQSDSPPVTSPPVTAEEPATSSLDKLPGTSPSVICKANNIAEEVGSAQIEQMPTAPESRPEESGEMDCSKPIQDIASHGNSEVSFDIDDADNSLIDMLSPFLKPPTPLPQQQQPRSPAESSYGMHTSTANELFASLEVGPTPTKSISSGKFEPLPWGWFNTPNPHKVQDATSSAGKDAFNGHYSAAQSPNMSVAAAQLPEDPFTTPSRPYFNTFGRSIVGEAASPSHVAVEMSHRERLLQTLNGSGAPRSSAFSQWTSASQDLSTSRQNATAPSVWDPRGFEMPLFTSSQSGFSQSSSLYHGTPGNGVHYNGQVGGGLVRSLSQEASLRESVPVQHLGRQFQVDKTASNYDEAILKAAYQGRR